MNNTEVFLLGFATGFFSLPYLVGCICCLYSLKKKYNYCENLDSSEFEKKPNGETINDCH